jgi:hypothetical protein
VFFFGSGAGVSQMVDRQQARSIRPAGRLAGLIFVFV